VNNLYTVKKAENCFADAKSFAYTLHLPINERMLNKLALWGELTVRRNFRRPFFMLKIDEEQQVKGILDENILKAGFSKENWEKQKEQFEQKLSDLLVSMEDTNE